MLVSGVAVVNLHAVQKGGIFKVCYTSAAGVGLVDESASLVKDPAGKPMPSPFVAMAQQYLKQTNEVWSKIYLVVRETKLSKWDDTNPNDDIMEKILGGKP